MKLSCSPTHQSMGRPPRRSALRVEGLRRRARQPRSLPLHSSTGRSTSKLIKLNHRSKSSTWSSGRRFLRTQPFRTGHLNSLSVLLVVFTRPRRTSLQLPSSLMIRANRYCQPPPRLRKRGKVMKHLSKWQRTTLRRNSKKICYLPAKFNSPNQCHRPLRSPWTTMPPRRKTTNPLLTVNRRKSL